MTRRASIVAFIALSLGVMPVRAADPLSTTDVVTVDFVYIPGDDIQPTIPLEVLEGGALRYTNADIDLHTITSFKTIEGEPVFESGLIPPGTTVEMPGIASLAPGEYRFYCRIHPMFGRLQIVTERSFP